MISLVGPRWRDVTPESVGSGAPRDDDVRPALARTSGILNFSPVWSIPPGRRSRLGDGKCEERNRIVPR